jgi:hypothetical protein
MSWLLASESKSGVVHQTPLRRGHKECDQFEVPQQNCMPSSIFEEIGCTESHSVRMPSQENTKWKPIRLRVKHTVSQCVQCSNQRSDGDQNVRERVGTCDDVFGSD